MSPNPGRSNFKAILFDLDGTLIDTEPTAALAVQECFATWGIELNTSDSQYVTGRTWESALNFLFKKYRPRISMEDGVKLIMARYRARLENELIAVPGSQDAVRALSTRFPLAVVSGSSRDDIKWTLNKIGVFDCFRFILGAEDYERSKPEPDGYLKALEILKIEPQHILVFEDSLAGIAAARAAGLSVVAISGTNHFFQDISGAHAQIRDLAGINPDWVQKLATQLRVIK